MPACLQALQAHCQRISFTFIKPTGGYFYHLFPIDWRWTQKAVLMDYLDEAKVAVIPGNIMSVVAGKGYEHSFRLNLAKPTLAQIRQGIALLGVMRWNTLWRRQHI